MGQALCQEQSSKLLCFILTTLSDCYWESLQFTWTKKLNVLPKVNPSVGIQTQFIDLKALNLEHSAGKMV